MKKEKFSIKDIFTSEEPLEEQIIIETKTENRMVELVKSFDQKNEIIKEDKKKPVDQVILDKEVKRLKEITRLDEWSYANQFTSNIPAQMGIGATVNSFFDKKGETVNTFANPTNTFGNTFNNPNANKVHNPNYTYLQDGEALRLAISRTLNSGAPVNNLGFYEEVNLALNELGFTAKSALDIKGMILKMFEK